MLLGKTNMPPLANGGMQRGVYGRAESPYNAEFLTAAWASGSSNGSGTSTAANLAAFGMGEETVSSGRSPASNNALVAYTPSAASSPFAETGRSFQCAMSWSPIRARFQTCSRSWMLSLQTTPSRRGGLLARSEDRPASPDKHGAGSRLLTAEGQRCVTWQTHCRAYHVPR